MALKMNEKKKIYNFLIILIGFFQNFPILVKFFVFGSFFFLKLHYSLSIPELLTTICCGELAQHDDL